MKTFVGDFFSSSTLSQDPSSCFEVFHGGGDNKNEEVSDEN